MNSVLVDSDFISNIFKFNPELLSKFPKNQTFGEFYETPDFVDAQTLSFEENETKPNLGSSDLIDLGTLSLDQTECYTSSEIPDFPDNCLKFISDILLEENLDENPASAQEFRALEATEKSLYEVLGESYPLSSDNFPEFLNQNTESPDSSCSNRSFGSSEPSLGLETPKLDPIVDVDDFVHSFLDLNSKSPGSSSEDTESNKLPSASSERGEKSTKGSSSRRKKSRQRDDTDEGGGGGGGRSNKIQAADSDDYVEMKEYDDVLLCSESIEDAPFSPNECSIEEAEARLSKLGGSRNKKGNGKKQNIRVDEVDLRTLLIQCAQAVSSFDLRTANDLLKQIRQHCSPYGDSIQRLAHLVANGLEARLAGTGSTVSTNFGDIKISPSDFLKAYRVYVSAIPFKRMTYFLANSTIFKLAEKVTKIHVIDFGVFLGLQWPCFIQALSKRPNGPPKLRITGVDVPQQGFRPAERVNATGRRLAGYCERFGVPFEYDGIVDKWENLQPKDFKIESDEMVIVNCMWRSGTLLDETVEANSPRDSFLRLIRNLEPDLFIHGICNGTFTAPFFVNRFKEALFHYSSAFEVFDATLPRESHERLLIESEIYGKEITNVVACEGVERVQRPETYKQWQVRSTRAGFKQVPLEREILSQSKAMVKANYHKDFLVDEDKNWMLQGWKGRISCALSFWQPS